MPPPLPAEDAGTVAPRSPGELFLAFTWVSMQAFGGAAQALVDG